MPSMDPTQWKEETERVAIRLKNKEVAHKLNGDWNGHLSILKDYINNDSQNNINHSMSKKTINRKVSDKNDDDNIFSNLLANGDRDSIVENLDLLRNNLSQQIISLNRSQNVLNSREKVISMSAEYGENKKVIRKV